MIDHLIRFNSEAEAIADPVVGQYRSEEGGWRGDCCFPGQQVWRPEDDTVATDPESGAEYAVNHPLPYWYITISLPNVDYDLAEHSACMVVWNVIANELIYSPFMLEQLGEFRLSPVPSGRNYPYQ